MSEQALTGVEQEFSPYLLGANWLLQLARVNRDLRMPELLQLLSEEVEGIRRNPTYFPDDGRLWMSDATRAALIEGAMTRGRYKVKV